MRRSVGSLTALLAVAACFDYQPTQPSGDPRIAASHLGNGAENQPRFVYVANDGCCTDVGSVSGYAVQSDGSLLELPGSPFRTSTMYGCISLAVHPTTHFLYVTCDLSLDVTAFAIGSDGTLTPFQTIPVPSRGRLVTHRSGQFVYLYRDTGAIQGFAVQSDGSLIELPGSPFPAATLNHASSAAFDRTGSYLYVANNSGNNVSVFRFQEDGSLVEMQAVPSGSFPARAAAHPTADYLYVTTGDQAAVWEYRIDLATGGLTKIGAARAERGPTGIAVEPSGRFAYVANRNSNSITPYRIASNGILSKASTKSTSAPGGPWMLAVEPAGHFLYSAAFIGNQAAMFAIDPGTGLLSAGPRTPTGLGPFDIVALARQP